MWLGSGLTVSRYWHLQPGAYIVEFNEKVAVPLDVVGFILPRSSFWRSGGVVESGVCDAGYEGAMGCLLQVSWPEWFWGVVRDV